jgi:hypothetical protein
MLLLRLRGWFGRGEPFLPFYLAYPSFRINGKQHEMVEAYSAEVVVLVNIKVELSLLWQPKFGIGLLEQNRAIFHRLMFVENLKLRNRVHQF